MDYGIDWSGPVVDDEVNKHVVVPDTLNLKEALYPQHLDDPLGCCDDFGKGFYVTTRQLVREMVA